jgi:hypothetical protein
MKNIDKLPRDEQAEPGTGGGPCCVDPFAELPPEQRPAPERKNTGLRKTTCPECGLVYWTNRPTEVCIHCSS